LKNGFNEGGGFMILGREACNGAWESLSWKPRMKRLEFLEGGSGDLMERIGKLRAF